MASVPVRRLLTLFSKPTTTVTATATAKSPPKPILTSADKDFKSIVDKFLRATRSQRFRHHNSYAYSNTIRRLVSAKQFSLVEHIIDNQKQYKEITTEGFTVRLLSLYGKSGMFSHARKLFDEMPDLKCERTVKSFNALLSACVHCKEFDQILNLFNTLPNELALKPDLVSYNIVIKAFCEMGSFDEAISLIEEMGKGENGLEPDTVTFNTLLEGFYAKGMFPEAEKVLEMMKERDIVKSSRSFNPKIRALVVKGSVLEAVKVIDEMKREGVEPDTFSYNSLLKGFCDSGNMEEAKRLFLEMGESGCKPDKFTYIQLGYLACKMDDYDYAFELCKEAIKGKHVVHKTMVQRAVDGLVKESKMEEAKELVELGNSESLYSYDLKLPEAK